MINKLILIIAFSVVLNANLDLKIKNILGYGAYSTHKNLINYIFSNKSAYYDANNQVNYVLVTDKLQANGLLKLNLGSTQYIDISFTISNKPKISLKILKDILKSLGHYYYFTEESITSDDSLKWSIKLKTAAAINPLRLSQELQANGCKVTDIIREGNNKWSYKIDSNNANINKTEDLIVNNQLTLKKSLRPYMLKINGASSITIDSHSGNDWYPNVVFYDENLNIIEIFRENSLHKNLKLDVPNDTKYIKIDDLFTLANIKRGINITKE